MRPVQRSELLDYVTYTERREALRAEALAAKAVRRVHVGPHLTVLFENRDTVRYQVQEMMRVERLVKEADIAHELATYNELLGGPGELGATLLVEIDDAAQRQELLPRWVGMLPHLYAVLPDGRRVAPAWDARQVGRGRLSAVQYLRFSVGDHAPSAVGCSFDDPLLRHEAALSSDARAALQADLLD